MLNNNPTAIVIVGCGPGGPDYVTPLARQAVAHADVLIGAERLFALFPESTVERIPVTADIQSVLETIAERHGQERIVVLVTGDPGLMSLAAPVVRRFGRDNCRIIPGISAVQVACARLGLSWQNLRIIDAHGAEPDIDPRTLAGTEQIAVLCAKGTPWLRHLASTLGDDYCIYECLNLTLADEQIRCITSADLREEAISQITQRALRIVLFVKDRPDQDEREKDRRDACPTAVKGDYAILDGRDARPTENNNYGAGINNDNNDGRDARPTELISSTESIPSTELIPLTELMSSAELIPSIESIPPTELISSTESIPLTDVGQASRLSNQPRSSIESPFTPNVVGEASRQSNHGASSDPNLSTPIDVGQASRLSKNPDPASSPHLNTGLAPPSASAPDHTPGTAPLPSLIPSPEKEPIHLPERSWERQLPHFKVTNAFYFITFTLQKRARSSVSKDALLAWQKDIIFDAIRFWDGKKYELHAAVVMPDHVHLALCPHQGLSSILHSLKSFTAHAINKRLHRKGSLWLDEYYEKVIRGEQEFADILNYIAGNPLKARLAQRYEDYRWLYIKGWIHDEYIQ